MKWFKNTLIFSTMLAAAAVPAAAGIRVTMEETDLRSNQTVTSEILLDEGRLRANTDDGAFVFLTQGGRRILAYDADRNEYREIDEATMQQMAAQLGGAMAALQQQLEGLDPAQRAVVERMMKGKGGFPGAGAPQPRPQTVYAQQGSGSVNGFSCTEYKGTRAGQPVADVCAALPGELGLDAAYYSVFDEMREFMGTLMDTLASSPLAAAISNPFDDEGYEGFPVERTSYDNGNPTRHQELQSIEDATFTDADFSFGNARKVDMMPQGFGQ